MDFVNHFIFLNITFGILILRKLSGINNWQKTFKNTSCISWSFSLLLESYGCIYGTSLYNAKRHQTVKIPIKHFMKYLCLHITKLVSYWLIINILNLISAIILPNFPNGWSEIEIWMFNFHLMSVFLNLSNCFVKPWFSSRKLKRAVAVI